MAEKGRSRKIDPYRGIRLEKERERIRKLRENDMKGTNNGDSTSNGTPNKWIPECGGLDTRGFEYELCTQEEIRRHIRECEGKHVQQAVYSTFMDTLTQICFTCRKIRGSIAWDGNRSWGAK